MKQGYFTRLIITAFCAGLLSFSAAQTRADTRALLVGISDYYHLDADLKGPRNDVALMLRALMSRGIAPENITVLSEGLNAAPDGVSEGKPTRAAIMAAMAELSADSAAGDTAIFYFSGHGSQMPDANGDEQGGYDQIFLPADAKNWQASIGAVENALVDDEFRAWSADLLSRGAQLVAIVDACHSGTGFRALDGAAGAARYVDPAALGVPGEPEPGEAHDTGSSLSGEFVFLYSSQSDQRSFEYPLGDGQDPANWYGDFTRNLAQILETGGALSYGQWLQAARDQMRKSSATATQTPDGEGTLLESAVFGDGNAQTRLPLKDGQLQRGALSGIAPGAVYAVYDAAAGGEPLGQVEVVSVDPTQAKLKGRDGFVTPTDGYAVELSPGFPPMMAIAPPRAALDHDGYEYRPMTEAFDALAGDDLVDGVRLAEAGFDAALVLMDGTLALTGRDGVVDPNGPESSPRFRYDRDGDIQEQLALWLERIGRVHRMTAALNGVKSGGFSIGGTGLKVALERRPTPTRGDTCAKPRGAEPVGDGGALRHCDQLWINLTNLSRKAQDVTVLYIDRDFHVSALWPEPSLSNRIESGGEKSIGMRIVNDSAPDAAFASGLEELIVLAVPVDPDAPRVVLTALADGASTRAGTVSPLESFLGAAASTDATTRNFSLTGAIAPLKVTRFGFEVLPREDE
ncbi:caspase family protein [Shimia abyssi]|uniref:Caspase domain-containing protein n=1 Tax=Shimia abyssi TaxID=1662395 RepID=A0A2P8FBS0_9RHOB|nr:caspase family protein [Shimia abyssi]PSL19187.1 caspase domain-containing protein [Shimia abyssi]